MEDRQANHTANKFEVVQMLWINAGMRIGLQGIIIMSGIFEETVERIEHFVGEKEEKFTVAISKEKTYTWLTSEGHTEKDHHSLDHLHHQI